MMVYKCDRCGHIYEQPDDIMPERYEVTYGIGKYDDPQGTITCDVLDLCPNCYNSFLAWVERWVKKEGEIS